MSKALPDKWVRKSIYDAVSGNISLNGIDIPIYDTRVTEDSEPQYYILMTTQNNNTLPDNKCEDSYLSSILLDVICRYDGAGNYGSRLDADDIMEQLRALTYNLTLDVWSNLSIVWQRQDFPNDINTVTDNEQVYRKLMRIEFYIN